MGQRDGRREAARLVQLDVDCVVLARKLVQRVEAVDGFIRAHGDGAGEAAQRFVVTRGQRLLDEFDPYLYTQLNQRFHAVLFDRCPNPHILDLVGRGWSRLAGLRDTSFALIPSRPRHSVEEHDRILELIRTGADPDELEMFTRNHRLRTLDAFLQARHENP